MCVVCGGTCTFAAAIAFKYKGLIMNSMRSLLCHYKVKKCSYKCEHLKVEGRTTKYHLCIYDSSGIKHVDLHDICCRI